MDMTSQELQTKEAGQTQLGFLAQSCAAKADIDKRIQTRTDFSVQQFAHGLDDSKTCKLFIEPN